MVSKLRTEISIESNESFVVRRKRYSIRAWCDCCERTAIFVLPTEASFLAGRDLDEIVSLVYTGQLHIFEAPKKGAYVCLTSLCMLQQTPDADESDMKTVHKELSDIKDRELLFLETGFEDIIEPLEN